MDRTKHDAPYEDFLGKDVAETEDVVDNDGYPDYHDDSSATHKIPDYYWASLFVDNKNYSDFEGF